MKEKILFCITFLFLLLAGCKGDANDEVTEETEGLGIMTTISRVRDTRTCAKDWDGDYCADVAVKENNSANNLNLVVTIADGYLKIIHNEDKTVVEGFEKVFFDEDGYSIFETNGKEYQIRILDKMENCFKGNISQRCYGKTQKGKRCKARTLDESGYCWRHK
ncbi:MULTISPECIES: hypothetical protein [Flavobacterium]|uniref:hypothetical protein n=1 Tax=Flavobacterium TaxID=237 RepID=UPI00086D87C5|nr:MULTISPECIES: hypothetical protein [Flavobacterium]MBN9286267.1 hypothetical protein [Flavobacterium sp.]ODS79714.1 MAG: hypothetical protein ABS44_21030 [Chryseobacterium sp. SCN 40-13]OJV73788.1 MAG: hypothetical protein BGO42_14780 [Flavobacterium sp. 40-81]